MDRNALTRELDDLENILDDLRNARFQLFGSVLARYGEALGPNTEISAVAAALLPTVDLDSWLEAGHATGGSMVGSKRLDWPTGKEERVALQLGLLRKLAADEGVYRRFVLDFLYTGKRYDDNNRAFVTQIVRPFHRDFMSIMTEVLGTNAPVLSRRAAGAVGPTTPDYVAIERLAALRGIKSSDFDYSKLIRLCEELNQSWKAESLLATAMIVRAILDHVPPIFGARTFKEVVNNYGGGGKSFKDAMHHLEGSARKIADAFLHSPIRSRETLPTRNQVDISNSLDLLLSEIVRIA